MASFYEQVSGYRHSHDALSPTPQAVLVSTLRCPWRRRSRFCALVALAIGLVRLAGQIDGLTVLHAVIPGLACLHTSCALGIVAASLALWLRLCTAQGTTRTRIGRFLAWLLVGLGLTMLCVYWFDRSFDNFLFSSTDTSINADSDTDLPNTSAVNFILMGIALLLMDRPSKRSMLAPAQLLAILVAIPAAAALLTYLYSLRDLFREGSHHHHFAMLTFPTALGWFVLAAGILFARPDIGVMRAFSHSYFGRYSLRRLLLPAMIILPALGALLHFNSQLKLLTPGTGAATFVVICGLALVMAILSTAAGLHAMEERQNSLAKSARMLETDLRTVFDLSQTGMAKVSIRDGRLMRVNRQFCELTGYSEKELLTMSCRELTHPDDDAVQWPLFQAANQVALQEFKFEKRCIRKDGSILWVETSGIGLPNDGEMKPSYSFVFIHDASDRKEWEESLKQAKTNAETASAMKSAFLANMSHELRTPLAAASGFADLLQNDEHLTAEERKSFAATIKRNTKVLTQLIDDILDLSKIEAGKFSIRSELVDLCDLINDVLLTLSATAKPRGIELSIDSQGLIPMRITSDRLRLRQILMNIIGNAIKFTPAGSVSVCVRLLDPSTDGSQKLAFIVRDTGIGISNKLKDQLFQPFAQGDASNTRRYGGAGLGLALSRRLAQALGGDIELTSSRPNRGSTFTITVATGSLVEIPTLNHINERQTHLMSQKINTVPALQGLHILVAEDAPDNQLVLKKILVSQGATVAVVSNGFEAIEATENASFDVILMDLQMPQMDGIEATRTLRGRGIKTPIIALTAHALNEERMRSAAAGCNNHLTKPIDSSKLIETLCAYQGQVRSQAIQTQSALLQVHPKSTKPQPASL